MKSGETVLALECDGHTWSYLSSGYACVDCVFDTGDICASAGLLTIVPPPSTCSPWLLGRTASTLEINSLVVPPPGIPVLNEVVAVAKRKSFEVTVNVTAFATGGTLFCAATPVANGISTITIGQVKTKGNC